ncbi:MAG: sulfotransferase, partial [Bacteroidota bacterium]
MNSNLLPTFLIIGAAKSGTTSLYDFLVQHPEVFMSSIKEPRFFKYEGQTIDPKDPVNQSVITDFETY